MSEIDELLNSEMEHIESESMVNDEILVNPITRMMDVPISERLFGVVEDANVEKKYFRCPRYVGDDIDLSKLKIYMKYVHAIGNTPEEWEDTIPQFTWCDDVKVLSVCQYYLLGLVKASELMGFQFLEWRKIWKLIEVE